MTAPARVPEEVCTLFGACPRVGDRLQGFPLLTTSESRVPQVTLLSVAEIELGAHRGALHLAIASRRATASLRHGGTALFMAVSGTTAHYLTLQPARSIEFEGLFAVVADVVHHEADSVGMALDPLTFRVTEELVIQERWDRSTRALAALADEPRSASV